MQKRRGRGRQADGDSSLGCLRAMKNKIRVAPMTSSTRLAAVFEQEINPPSIPILPIRRVSEKRIVQPRGVAGSEWAQDAAKSLPLPLPC